MAKKQLWKLVFLAPAVTLFILIVAEPFFRGFFYSFTDWNGFSKEFNIVFLDNYIHFFKDPSVLLPIQNSFFYTAITVIFNNITGLLLALLINCDLRGINAFRAIYFMPFVISFVLCGFLWSFSYSDIIGVFLGIPSPLGNIKTVIPAIAGISLWRDSGYTMIIYLAALQGISPNLKEAAKIDGANPFHMFYYITVPGIAPAFTINIALFLGWGIKVFDYVMTATGGGPGRASETLAIYVYKYTFNYNKVGYGQTVAVYMMILVFVLSGGATYLLRKRETQA